MEQQRKAARSGWYHETQSSQHGHLPLDPHAAKIQDRFLLGLDVQLDPTLHHLLNERQGLLRASRACYDVLFPDSLRVSRTETLSLYDRLSSALTVAQVSGVQSLCSHYAARLAPLSSPDASRESNLRQTHITQFARLLATQPTLIAAPMLTQLYDVGFSTQDIVTFTQLIGFVSYQARVLAIINGLRGRAAAVLPGFPSPEGCEQRGFSLALLQWTSRLPEVAADTASQHQQDVLDLIAPDARSSSFYTLLVHDADALSEFSAVFNNIMQAGERPKAAWRELAAVATSQLNGCLYCAGIHGRLYLEAGGDEALIGTLFNAEHPDDAIDDVAQKRADLKEVALLEAVITLTRTPERFDARQLQKLSDVGYSAIHSLDILLTAALFGWSNRLVQTLGDTLNS